MPYRFDHNYSIAKEFAGWPRVAHHAAARRAVDGVGHEEVEWGSYYNNPCSASGKRFADAFYSAVQRIVGGAEIDDQHLILGVIDDCGQISAKLGEFGGIELAEEDGELRVVAATFEVVEDLVAAFVVGNVVADDVVASCSHCDKIRMEKLESSNEARSKKLETNAARPGSTIFVSTFVIRASDLFLVSGFDIRVSPAGAWVSSFWFPDDAAHRVVTLVYAGISPRNHLASNLAWRRMTTRHEQR